MDIKNLMKITSIILIFLIVFSIIPVISYATDSSSSGWNFIGDFIKKIGEVISLIVKTIFNPKEKVDPVVPDKLTISTTSQTIEVGGSFTITANKVVKWSSTNSNAATVDGKGKVTGVGVGKTDIVASTSDGETAKCVVNVNDKTVPTKSFVEIAKECKKVICDNKFTYSQRCMDKC